MEEFPSEFDLIIYGTGLVESIVSAAASLIGKKVLQVDRYQQYGSVACSLRFSDLLLIKNQSSNLTNENKADEIKLPKNLFKTKHNFDSIEQLSIEWHIPESGDDFIEKKESVDSFDEVTTDVHKKWCRKSLEKELSRAEVDILPKVLLSRSELINAVLQSDVSRYLEFLFVKNIFTMNKEGKIIHIPQNRNDVFESDILSLIQKRRFTKFMQWCLTSNCDDPVYQKNRGKPLKSYLMNELKMDKDVIDAVIHGLIIAPNNISFEEGIDHLKKFLVSVNRFGPFPMIVPQYGSSDIAQGFCRMSAVFGAVFCLDCHVKQIIENETKHEEKNAEDYSLKVDLSINQQVKTKHFITTREYLKSKFIQKSSEYRFTARAVYVTNKSLFAKSINNGDNGGFALLTIPFEEDQCPLFVLESLYKKNVKIGSLYFVHVSYPIQSTSSSSSLPKPKELIESIEKMLFSSENHVEKLVSLYFIVPDYTKCDISMDLLQSSSISSSSSTTSSCFDNIHVLPGATQHWHMEEEVRQAEELFRKIFPNDKFLPSPPKPEDILYDGNASNEETIVEGKGEGEKEEDKSKSDQNNDDDDHDDNKSQAIVDGPVVDVADVIVSDVGGGQIVE